MWLGEQSSHLSLWAVSTLYCRTVGPEQVPAWGGGKNVAGETLGSVLMELQEPFWLWGGSFQDSPSPPSFLISAFHSRVRGSHFQLGGLLGEDEGEGSSVETLQHGEETNPAHHHPRW